MKFLIPVFLLFAISCQLFEKDRSEGALAKVHDKYLYKEDITDLLGKMKGDKDSALIVANYIHNWIQQELLLQKAELNLREDQKDFQKLLYDYRRSLVIYAYQKEWVRLELDTNVSDQEISTYYEKNQGNFELKRSIVRMRFAEVFRTAPKLDQLEQLIQSEEAEDRDQFRDYCLQYAADYNDNDSIWIPIDQVLDKLPVHIEDEEHFLRNRKFIVNADSTSYYLLYIEDYKIKNDISPLSFEREKIRNIIINKRKLELLAKMKRNIFETALEKGNAEIYTN